MRLHICAVGRLRAGPEQSLIDDYLQRAERAGRNLGLGPCKVHEVEDKKGGGKDAEAALLEKAAPSGAAFCLLDERGRQMNSPEFAKAIAEWRDEGRGDIAFLIGGADGHAPALRQKADLCVSFGKMVWPHMLARVMLAEQIYRSVSILAGSPYHRA